MHKIKSSASFALTLGLFYLATSLLVTTFEIRNMRRDIPHIIEQFETMETSIDIAGILKTIDGVNEQIPLVLTQVEESRKTLDRLNTQIPSILNEVSALRQSTIPSLIKESEALRAEMPIMLEKADKLATKVNNIPENMTKSFAKGTVKTVISAPTDIVKGVGEGVGNTLKTGAGLIIKQSEEQGKTKNPAEQPASSE